MTVDQTIDFLRGDLGLWVLFIVIPLAALCRIKRANLGGRDGRRMARVIVVRMVFGLVIASTLTGLLAIWQRWPPQYFVKLTLGESGVTLGFRWPAPEAMIPYRDLKDVSVVTRRSSRRTTSRVKITTPAHSYLSYGFSKLDPEEIELLDQLRAKIPVAGAASLNQRPP